MTVTSRRTAAPPPAVPSPGPAEARPELRVVTREAAPQAQRRPRVRAVTVVTLVLSAAALFGLVAAHVALTQGQFRLERLDGRVAEEKARYERLRLEVARLESPERVVAVAQERLGMVPPPEVTYLSPTGSTSAGPATRVARPATSTQWSVVKRHLASRP